MLVAVTMTSLLYSCATEPMPFDPVGWNKPTDLGYRYRAKMVNDLLENHLAKGMTKAKAIELLGSPQNNPNIDPSTVQYEIEEDYGHNIDPVHGKTLVLTFQGDSVLVNTEIVDW